MVGTCTALHLAMRGRTVVLLDRRDPGRETSYGNAGLIQREAVMPYPFPRRIGPLVNVALKRSAAVNYHWTSLAGMASGLFSYWLNSSPARYAVHAKAYANLIELSTLEHDALIRASDAVDLVTKSGYLHVFRSSQSFAAAAERAVQLGASHGVNHAVWSSQHLSAAEPALRQSMAGALYWLDPWSVKDPGGLVTRYAARFQRLGGVVVSGDAMTLQSAGNGWSVRTTAGLINAEEAVIALGPWSPALLAKLGYRLPFFPKRGYHKHYAADLMPTSPMYDADRGMVMAPTVQGLRVTTGAEFASVSSPKTPWQLESAERSARELLALGEAVEAEPWMGARPCTPDMNPVVSAAPCHRGLWVNTGHAHQGFTLGPVCGRLLSELMNRDTPVVDPGPYDLARFF
ncbi:MAG: FAD-dependent oxidoreductase [Comamonadaceae bacterium]|nr:MAG: FAD-dependent oxidoreductase [Comamonadaceae bacterium]